MAGRALWRRAYDAVERPVGSRLETAVQTDAFADIAGLLLRARAGVERRIERNTRRALHRVNLPAASDVSRLREQVADLHRTVRRLEDALADARTGVRPDARLAAGPVGGGSTHGDDDGSGRPGVPRAPRRRTQPAARAQRGEVRGGDRPAAGRDDAEGHRLAT